VILHSKTKR